MTTTEAAPSRPETPPAARRWVRWGRDVVIGLALFAAISFWQGRHLLDEGVAAPAFALARLDGAPVRLESLRGKTVLLHFWATWCGVCRQEHSALNAIQAGLDDDEVLLSVVADAEDQEALRKVIAEEHITYPVLLGTDDVIADYRVNAYPTNYYLDESGRISTSTVGMSNRLAMRLRMALAGL